MIVGVGASRVRDLFTQAKAAAPSIIFIDEIDAIGLSRSSGALSGANDEREQTLNQILTEMDGFDASTGVIVLAATNRADVLDQALLRPGRFDRRVTVQPPDKDGREQILRVHTAGFRCARRRPGRRGLDDGGDGRRGSRQPRQRGGAPRSAPRARAGDDGRPHRRLEKIELGTARKLLLTDADKWRTAYHEGGHALVGMLTPAQIPSGDLDHPAHDEPRRHDLLTRRRALQLRQAGPDRPHQGHDRRPGREEVVYGDETTGAESDIRQATQLARNMVGRFGMSDEIGHPLGPPARGRPVRSTSGLGADAAADRRRDAPDRPGAHDEAVQLLTENRQRLDSLAQALFQAETLGGASGVRGGRARPRRRGAGAELALSR